MFNTHVGGFEVDAYWPRHKVVVEVDGYATHGHRQAFERDRARDNALVAGGYVVLRFTWHRLTREPMAVVADDREGADCAHSHKPVRAENCRFCPNLRRREG